MTFKLPKDVKAKWIAALRSGLFLQGCGTLKSTNEDGETEHCCLGVAREIKLCRAMNGGINEYVSGSFLPQHIQEDLADLNDSGKSFQEIADWIEKNL